MADDPDRYAELESLLKAKKWYKADEKTHELMIITTGKEVGQWFDRDALLNFPCEDLKVVDELWMRHSNGQFGFSVQKQIYLDCGASLNDQYPSDEVWDGFCDRVGWRDGREFRDYLKLQANPNLSPSGEFPCGWCWGEWLGRELFSALAQRFVTCNTNQS